jgi:hypothetical protein
MDRLLSRMEASIAAASSGDCSLLASFCIMVSGFFPFILSILRDNSLCAQTPEMSGNGNQSAQNANRWHTQQKNRAKSFIPKLPELPGDYAGGGVISGRSQTPDLPPGTEKETFVPSQSHFPREWWVTMSVAVMMFVICTMRRKT